MTDHPPTPSRETFVQWVHEALNQLYDAPYLQTHPLALMLAEPGMEPLGRDQHLRRTLINAIQRLRPEAGVSAQSPRWRAYQLMELRYIAGLAPAEVMHELALSRSTYFREQARMIEALAGLLWDGWQQAHSVAVGQSSSREQLAQAEITRLSANATWAPTEIGPLLESLRPIVEPLARATSMTVSFCVPHLSIMHADRVLVRQAILNVITYGLDVVPAGQLEVCGFVAEGEAGVQVRAGPTAGGPPIGAPQRAGVGLEVCRRCMAIMGGQLRLASSADAWQAQLVWPVATPPVLLVVDDNEELVGLFRRYLTGHNWRVVGAADGCAARQLLAEQLPTVIALDVIMPREDGWEFLVAVRADERTRDIPVIICSVLNEPQLAAALGAAYLPKPISQSALLRALLPWAPVGASPPPTR